MFPTIQNHIVDFGEGGSRDVHNLICFAITSDNYNASMSRTTSPTSGIVGGTIVRGGQLNRSALACFEPGFT